MRWLQVIIFTSIAACLCGYIALQKQVVANLEVRAAALEARVSEVIAANVQLEAALASLEHNKARSDALVSIAAQKTEELSATARALDKKLKEALRHAPITAHSLLPGDAVLALCLRYQAAAFTPGGDSARGPASGSYAREADTPAALCSSWQAMTVEDSLEWLGLLLDHAGAERLDKEALRAWASREDVQ